MQLPGKSFEDEGLAQARITPDWFGGLTVLNIILGVTMGFTALVMKNHWNEMLAGAALSSLTTFVLSYGILIPIVIVTTSVVGWILCIKNSLTPKAFNLLFSLIIVAQTVYACIHMLGLVFPSLKITYRLG